MILYAWNELEGALQIICFQLVSCIRSHILSYIYFMDVSPASPCTPHCPFLAMSWEELSLPGQAGPEAAP